MSDRGSEQHRRVRDLLLGPYVLGGLNPDEEREVEKHLEECAACREEERGLRETHERLSSVALAAVSPRLKEHILSGLPPPDEMGTPVGEPSRRPWLRRVAAAAAGLILVLAAAYFAAGLLSDPAAETASLAPTELAPGARGELEMRAADSGTVANLEVWGLPRPGPREYYELWVGGDDGRVSAGTFTVDAEGWGRLSATCANVEGDYRRAGVTLETFPEEPRLDEAKVVLGGDLRGT